MSNPGNGSSGSSSTSRTWSPTQIRELLRDRARQLEQEEPPIGSEAEIVGAKVERERAVEVGSKNMSEAPSREEFEARLREQEAKSAARFAELMGEVRTSNAELRGSVSTAFAELRGEFKALPTKNEERNYFLGLLGTIFVVAFGLTAMYYSHQQSTQAALANGISIGEASRPQESEPR